MPDARGFFAPVSNINNKPRAYSQNIFRCGMRVNLCELTPVSHSDERRPPRCNVKYDEYKESTHQECSYA